MKRFIFTSLCWLICASTVAAQSAEPDFDDNQLWLETSVALPLKKDLNLIVTPGVRVGRDFGHLVDERATVALNYKVSKNFGFAVGYLYRRAQPDAVRRGFENRIFANFTIAASLGKFALANRNQFEQRRNNSRPDSFVYRNRVALERDLKLLGTGARPVLAFETFYDSRLNSFFRQRLTIGAGKKLARNLSGDVFYTKQFDARSRPGNLNIVGAALRVQF